MSNDPMDVMNFLKEKKDDTFVDPVSCNESSEVANVLEAVKQAKEKLSETLCAQPFTPQSLPTDETQVPPFGTLTGKGPLRRKIKPGEGVMFRMGPDGVPVDVNGNKAPVFNPQKRCHLTVIDTVVHQLADEAPVAVDSRYTRWLTTDDQHFSRQKKIGEEWESIEVGDWIKQCGMLMIKNREGGRKLVNPSIEETEKDNAKVIEVAIDSYHGAYVSGDSILPFAIILPGESLRLQPVDLSSYRIRCRSGQCRVSVDAFPE